MVVIEPRRGIIDRKVSHGSDRTKKRYHNPITINKGQNFIYKIGDPISLLNSDYEIITLLALRLQYVLPSILNEDIIGKRRFTGQNIRLIANIFFMIEINKKPAVIVSINFETHFTP